MKKPWLVLPLLLAVVACGPTPEQQLNTKLQQAVTNLTKPGGGTAALTFSAEAGAPGDSSPIKSAMLAGKYAYDAIENHRTTTLTASIINVDAKTARSFGVLLFSPKAKPKVGDKYPVLLAPDASKVCAAVVYSELVGDTSTRWSGNGGTIEVKAVSGTSVTVAITGVTVGPLVADSLLKDESGKGTFDVAGTLSVDDVVGVNIADPSPQPTSNFGDTSPSPTLTTSPTPSTGTALPSSSPGSVVTTPTPTATPSSSPSPTTTTGGVVTLALQNPTGTVPDLSSIGPLVPTTLNGSEGATIAYVDADVFPYSDAKVSPESLDFNFGGGLPATDVVYTAQGADPGSGAATTQVRVQFTAQTSDYLSANWSSTDGTVTVTSRDGAHLTLAVDVGMGAPPAGGAGTPGVGTFRLHGTVQVDNFNQP